MKEKKEINVKIGKRVRNARENAGFTQENLAESIDVSVQYISDMERGIVGASCTTIIKLCKALNVSCDYILLGQCPSHDNFSFITNRLSTLSESQLDLVEQAINLILSALNHGKKNPYI